MTAPTSGTYTAGDVVAIEWVADGVVSGSTISLCYDEDTTWWNGNEHWIAVDSVPAADGAGSYNWDTTDVEEGAYYIAGYMYDYAGTFTYSRLNQAIQIQPSAQQQSFDLTGPTSGTYTAGDVVSITWTAGGVVPGSTISLCYDEDTTWWNGNEHWIAVDSIQAADGSHSYNWDTSAASAGTYYIAGYMYDYAGTFTYSRLYQTIQIQPGAQQQSFDLTGPTSGTYTAGDIVSITWTAGGVVPGSTISLCYDEDTTWWNGNEHWIAVDSIQAADGSHSYNWDTSTASAGTYYIAGYMYDYAGTFTYSRLYQTIQIQPGTQQQSFDLTGPTSGTYTAGDIVSITWTAGGVVPGSTISLCYDEDTTWWNGNEHWIVVDGIQAADGSHSYNWDTSTASAGTYYIAGYMYDYAGTFTYSRLYQTIQIQPGAQEQTFDLTGPTSGTYTAGDIVSITWTAGGVVPGSVISLCYDEDTTLWNGNEHWIEIDQVAAANGEHSYSWNTAGVSAGTYYVAGYMYDYAGTFTYSHLNQAIQIQGDQPQSFVLTGPTLAIYQVGNTVPIQWTAGGVVSGSKISLCYDEDTTWWNGNEHWIEVDQVAAANGDHSYNWNTTGVASGIYFIAGYMYDFVATSVFSHLEDPIYVGVLPLQLAVSDGAEAADDGQAAGTTSAPLADAELQAMAADAIAGWQNVADTAGQLEALHHVSFVVTDLPGALLGIASPETIYIDVDAAGRGWFVDPTPATNEEFRLVAGELRALDSAAVDRVDLLTVLYHELGHNLGLEDLDPTADSLMSDELPVGLRRTPTELEIDLLLALQP